MNKICCQHRDLHGCPVAKTLKIPRAWDRGPAVPGQELDRVATPHMVQLTAKLLNNLELKNKDKVGWCSSWQ